MKMQVYKVLGVMSGTSLDGLDLAYCELIKGKQWEYKILASVTISYTDKRKKILQNASRLAGEELTALDRKFGKFIGEECKKFIIQHKLTPDLISSHGHTIFHQPEKGFTLQIGNGCNINVETGIPVISDFRSQDVALGGQGAPLVPIGDQLLFSEYDVCLNLGGFANISTGQTPCEGRYLGSLSRPELWQKRNRIAWDICAVNVVLNRYAEKAGLSLDKGGALARSGQFHKELFAELRDIPFYVEPPPKSLGIEWVEKNLIHLLEKYLIPIEDILHTYVCHIAELIGKSIDMEQVKKVLFTGGGVYNNFLMEKIKEKTKAIIDVPNDQTIQYKEALIFGLLGVLRWRGEINVLKSVTGASRDHCSGVIYGRL